MKPRRAVFAALVSSAVVAPFACARPEAPVSVTPPAPVPSSDPVFPSPSAQDAEGPPAVSAPPLADGGKDGNAMPSVVLWDNYDPKVVKTCADAKCPPAGAPGASGFLMNQCNSLERYLVGESQQRVLQCVAERADGGKNCDTAILYGPSGCLQGWSAHAKVTPEAKTACVPIVEKCGEYLSNALESDTCAQMLAAIKPVARKLISACIAGSCNRAPSRCAPTFISNPNAPPSSTWR